MIYSALSLNYNHNFAENIQNIYKREEKMMKNTKLPNPFPFYDNGWLNWLVKRVDVWMKKILQMCVRKSFSSYPFSPIKLMIITINDPFKEFSGCLFKNVVRDYRSNDEKTKFCQINLFRFNSFIFLFGIN